MFSGGFRRPGHHGLRQELLQGRRHGLGPVAGLAYLQLLVADLGPEDGEEHNLPAPVRKTSHCRGRCATHSNRIHRWNSLQR